MMRMDDKRKGKKDWGGTGVIESKSQVMGLPLCFR